MAKQLIVERITSNNLSDMKANHTWTLFVFLAGRNAGRLLRRAFGDNAYDTKTDGKDRDWPKLSSDTLMRLGINPITMIEAELTAQLRPEGMYSPLGFAIAMLNEDLEPDDALRALEWYHRHREVYNETQTRVYAGIAYPRPTKFWENGLVCPIVPEQFKEKYPGAGALERFGGTLDVTKNPFDQVPPTRDATRTLPLSSTFYGWLNEGQRLRARKYVNMGTLSRFYLVSKIHEGMWDEEVKKAARTLLRAESASQPNYHELTNAAQLIDNSDLVNWISKRKGVRQGLFVVRSDATEAQMTTGLRILLNSAAARSALMQHIGRPLIADEVAALRSPDIVDFLWECPWAIIEEVSKNRDRVLAKLMPHVGKVDAKKLRECLSPHKDRKGRIDPITSEAWLASQFERTDWLGKMTPILWNYRNACKIRKELLEQCGSVSRAFLLTLPSQTGEYSGNIDQALGKMTLKETVLRRDFHKRLKGFELSKHSSIAY